VPKRLLGRLDDTGGGWYGGTDEIDLRTADYGRTCQESGQVHSAITYLAKNAPNVARYRNYTYRLGGPILGERAG
jgi:hypothetical protein